MKNELVKRLSIKQSIESIRPEKNANGLKECIDREFVHIMFKKTNTEIGIQLDTNKCCYSQSDFEIEQGTVHLEGAITLNYDKVRCVADIDLKTCEGKGYLHDISDEEYSQIWAKNKFS